MEVRCSICGKTIELNKMHKDFQAVRQGLPVVFICDNCSKKTAFEARKCNEQIKPT